MECGSCGDVGCHLCMPPEPKKEGLIDGKHLLIVGAGTSSELVERALLESRLKPEDVIIVTPEDAKGLEENPERERGLTINAPNPFNSTMVFRIHNARSIETQEALKIEELKPARNYINGGKIPPKGKGTKKRR